MQSDAFLQWLPRVLRNQYLNLICVLHTYFFRRIYALVRSIAAILRLWLFTIARAISGEITMAGNSNWNLSWFKNEMSGVAVYCKFLLLFARTVIMAACMAGNVFVGRILISGVFDPFKIQNYSQSVRNFSIAFERVSHWAIRNYPFQYYQWKYGVEWIVHKTYYKLVPCLIDRSIIRIYKYLYYFL